MKHYFVFLFVHRMWNDFISSAWLAFIAFRIHAFFRGRVTIKFSNYIMRFSWQLVVCCNLLFRSFLKYTTFSQIPLRHVAFGIFILYVYSLCSLMKSCNKRKYNFLSKTLTKVSCDSLVTEHPFAMSKITFSVHSKEFLTINLSHVTLIIFPRGKIVISGRPKYTRNQDRPSSVRSYRFHPLLLGWGPVLKLNFLVKLLATDCIWTGTQNYLVRKQTLHHLAKLVECSFMN